MINCTWVSDQQPCHRSYRDPQWCRHVSTTWPGTTVIDLSKGDQIESESITLSPPDIWN